MMQPRNCVLRKKCRRIMAENKYRHRWCVMSRSSADYISGQSETVYCCIVPSLPTRFFMANGLYGNNSSLPLIVYCCHRPLGYTERKKEPTRREIRREDSYLLQQQQLRSCCHATCGCRWLLLLSRGMYSSIYRHFFLHRVFLSYRKN